MKTMSADPVTNPGILEMLPNELLDRIIGTIIEENLWQNHVAMRHFGNTCHQTRGLMKDTPELFRYAQYDKALIHINLPCERANVAGGGYCVSFDDAENFDILDIASRHINLYYQGHFYMQLDIPTLRIIAILRCKKMHTIFTMDPDTLVMSMMTVEKLPTCRSYTPSFYFNSRIVVHPRILPICREISLPPTVKKNLDIVNRSTILIVVYFDNIGYMNILRASFTPQHMSKNDGDIRYKWAVMNYPSVPRNIDNIETICIGSMEWVDEELNNLTLHLEITCTNIDNRIIVRGEHCVDFSHLI